MHRMEWYALSPEVRKLFVVSGLVIFLGPLLFLPVLSLVVVPGPLSLPLDLLRLLFSEPYMDLYSLVPWRSACKLLARLILPRIEDPFSCKKAAEQLLKWARANRCGWNDNTSRAAARHGHLELLQWARANGCEWRQSVCSAAAAGGHLVALQWARANGCLWDQHTCSEAARSGRLAVPQWARSNGCPWSPEVCAAAAGGAHLEMLQWARVNTATEMLGEWLTVERGYVPSRCKKRKHVRVAVGKGHWLSLDRYDLRGSRSCWRIGGAAVGALQWLSVAGDDLPGRRALQPYQGS
jgi:hypothetical protein